MAKKKEPKPPKPQIDATGLGELDVEISYIRIACHGLLIKHIARRKAYLCFRIDCAGLVQFQGIAYEASGMEMWCSLSDMKEIVDKPYTGLVCSATYAAQKLYDELNVRRW